jgi:FdhE protein
MKSYMVKDIDKAYERMLERVRELRRIKGELEEILSFHEKVLTQQRSVQPQILLPVIDLREEHLKIKIQEGFPLFERGEFPVDQERSLELFRRLCRISQGENPLLAQAGRILLEALDTEKLHFDELITAVVHDDRDSLERLAGGQGVAIAIVQALVKLSLQPSLSAFVAMAADRTSLENWQHSYCPLCGGLPAMAVVVGEEGRRQAMCSFCGHFWRLPRLGCPFCGTNKQEELQYFYGEGDDLYRVQVCDHCRGYLKTVDARKGGDVLALPVEDIVTAHLDLLAEQQGYQRKAPRIWGI